MRGLVFVNHYKVVFLYILALLPVISGNAAALPPDPDNAALLYYQAYEQLPEPDKTVSELLWPPKLENLYDVLRGGEFEPFTDTQKRIKEIEEEIKKRNIDPNENMTKESLFEDINEALFWEGDIFAVDDFFFRNILISGINRRIRAIKRTKSSTDCFQS